MLAHSRLHTARPRRGHAAVELALLLLFLPVLLVGTLDFARVFYHYITITNCARNGALYGCQNPTSSTDTTGIRTATLADAASLSPALTASNITSSTGNDANGNPYVEVTVSYSLPLITKNYLGIGSTVSIGRKVRMRVAQTTPKTS